MIGITAFDTQVSTGHIYADITDGVSASSVVSSVVSSTSSRDCTESSLPVTYRNTFHFMFTRNGVVIFT